MTESSLVERGFNFQALTEALPQIVWSCDAEGKHDYFSIRWSEFTGIQPDAITPETWKQLVYPDHWPLVSQVWEKAKQTGAPYHIDYRFRHHTGEYRWLRVMALPIRDGAGKITRWFGTSTDVHETYLIAQEREHLAQELKRIATEDQLTQVLTRRAFMEEAAAAYFAASQSAVSVGLLMLDIDHFKSINDSYGHPGGDRVLAIAAQRIKASVKSDDLVGRLGGEEFAVLLRDCSSSQAHQVAERIRRSMQDETIKLAQDRQVTATVSIGVVTDSTGAGTLDDMIIVADRALYDAKFGGRNRARVVGMPEAVDAGANSAGRSRNQPTHARERESILEDAAQVPIATFS